MAVGVRRQFLSLAPIPGVSVLEWLMRGFPWDLKPRVSADSISLTSLLPHIISILRMQNDDECLVPMSMSGTAV